MAARLLGAHMPIKGGVGNGLRSGKAIGCDAVQVFTTSPRQWYCAPVPDERVADFEAARVETGIECVVSHDSYLVNLCAPDEELAAKSCRALKDEIERCARYGIGFVVSHMGAHRGAGEDSGLRGVAEAARRLLDETPDSVTLCMETTAGQGTDLNWRFEHLAAILELAGGHPRLGVCLDTCHVFVAGYDLRTPETYAHTMGEFERLVGFDRLKVVHCNDSKKVLGSTVDRHVAMGQGCLGAVAFRCLVNDPRLEYVPILLETPNAEEEHAANLATLRALVAHGA